MVVSHLKSMKEEFKQRLICTAIPGAEYGGSPPSRGCRVLVRAPHTQNPRDWHATNGVNRGHEGTIVLIG